MSHGEFLVAMGASIVLRSGLDVRVHFKTRFDGKVGSVDAYYKFRKSVQWA